MPDMYIVSNRHDLIDGLKTYIADDFDLFR